MIKSKLSRWLIVGSLGLALPVLAIARPHGTARHIAPAGKHAVATKLATKKVTTLSRATSVKRTAAPLTHTTARRSTLARKSTLHHGASTLAHKSTLRSTAKPLMASKRTTASKLSTKTVAPKRLAKTM